MNKKLIIVLATAFSGLCDITIEDVPFLNEASRIRSDSISTHDSEAKENLETIVQRADEVLSLEPRPLEVLHYEGVLGTDPKRILTEEHLGDMTHLAWVIHAFYGNPEEKYRQFIKEYVSAWATTYIPTGNPINENKLEPVFCGYYLTRDMFSETQANTIDEWMDEIARLEDMDTRITNWETKRFKILAEISLATGKSKWMDRAVTRYKNYVPVALRSDGTSEDFLKRDAISYHKGGVRPLLTFCLLAEQAGLRIDGKSLYEWEASNGASVRKAVHFLDCYVLGVKQHMEFQNTQVDFDRQRCNAGLEKYCPHPFDPYDSNVEEIYELACGFEPKLSETAAELEHTTNHTYPSWLSALSRASVAEPCVSDNALVVLCATAPSSQENNGPHLVLDRKQETYWATEGLGKYIEVVLGLSPQSIDTIGIRWEKQKKQIYSFDIHVSYDGTTYVPYLEGLSADPETIGFENYPVAMNDAGRIRLVNRGNSGDEWIRIQEIRLISGETKPQVGIRLQEPSLNIRKKSLRIGGDVYSLSGRRLGSKPCFPGVYLLPTPTVTLKRISLDRVAF